MFSSCMRTPIVLCRCLTWKKHCRFILLRSWKYFRKPGTVSMEKTSDAVLLANTSGTVTLELVETDSQ